MQSPEERRRVERRLEELQKKHGEAFGPEIVIRDAKKKTSILHGCFTWDDRVAGHKFRIEEARRLIRSVNFVVRVQTIKLNVPAYVRNPDAAREVQSYSPTKELKSDRERAERALYYELDRLEASIDRVRRLAAGLGLEEYMAPLADALMAFRGHVDEAA